MFFGPQPAAWVAVAEAFQLQPFEPVAGFARGMGFRQLKRTLGVPVTRGVELKHWLYGAYRGAEAAILTFEEGSGSSTVSYTGVVVRVDPPLFLGLSLGRHGWIRLFEEPDIELGSPRIDAALRVTGANAERVRAFFDLRDPSVGPLIDRVMQLEALPELWVTDSTVGVAGSGNVVELRLLASWLGRATELAEALVRRGQQFAATPGERAQQAEWQCFADEAGFHFDARRMKLTAKSRPLEIALEHDGCQLMTAVTLAFPRAIDVGFAVRRTAAPSFLQGLFSQDIQVGDPAFDDRYIVTGFPEPRIRDLLRRPRLLAALGYLAGRTMEVQMNHAQLFFRLAGSSPTTAHLTQLTELATAVSAELFGEITAAHPFR